MGVDPARDRAPRQHAAAGAHRGAGGRGQADRRRLRGRGEDVEDEAPLRSQCPGHGPQGQAPDLSYGVSWFFGNAIGPAADLAASKTATDWHNIATAIQSTGNAFTFLGPSAKVIIDTLDSVSDVSILSAPSVLVRNNVEANFDSGQQIPVASTIINNNGNTNNDNTYSQVQFRQTGVSLKVKPRISSNGMVFMEITQDVSSPSSSGPVIGGNVSVDNNKLHTEVAVMSGETIALAGLIKTEQGHGSGGIPYLSRIPVVGALFGNHTVRDPLEARRYTDEYGERFRALEPLRKKEAKAQGRQ